MTHGFFTRSGGMSEGAFASLNCSLASGDNPDHVAENRRRVAGALGLAPDMLTNARQVHGVNVLTIDTPLDPQKPPEADGLVTTVPGLGLGILTADCVPILFHDAEAGVMGAAHAGWRSALGGVIANTLTAMQAAGADLSRIRSAIGPAISAENYEVGEKWAAEHGQDPAIAAHIVTPSGRKPHFDLPGFVLAQLTGAGIKGATQVGGCTYADPHTYFSHRRATHQGTKTGRHLSVIALRD